MLAVAAATGLVVASLTAGASPAGANPEFSQAHVDPAVYAALDDGGTTEFFVYLSETADLSAAATLDSKVAKAEFVYQELTSTAERSQADLAAELTERGFDFTSFWIANTLLVTGDRALVDELAARSDVASIEPNRELELIEPVEEQPADNSVQVVEWGVANINADDVWANFGVTGGGIVVASIDTGVQHTHPALVNQYRGTATGSHNHNWFDPTGICGASPCDNNGHGTHVTGTMVGDDGGANQIGVAPGAQWIAAKGCGTSSCASNTLLASGQWMVAPTDVNGNNPDPSMAPHVVNNSWGGGPNDTWYAATVNSWVAAGIFPMFANGNAGPSCGSASSPGDYPQSYSVGAYDINNNIANFSGRGASQVDGSIKPNLAAPGVSVRSSVPTNGYANFSGTSMASPHAAGVLALVWSAAPGLRGDIAGTRGVLDGTARDTSNLQCGGTAANNNVFGEGRIDALAAVTLATGGTPPPPPPPPPPPNLQASFTFSCTVFFFFRFCSFDGSSSTGAITSYSWDFGDGTTGSGQTATRFYSSAGTRNVTLTVADGTGATDSTTQAVPVP
jgi:hypothetical protein